MDYLSYWARVISVSWEACHSARALVPFGLVLLFGLAISEALKRWLSRTPLLSSRARRAGVVVGLVLALYLLFVGTYLVHRETQTEIGQYKLALDDRARQRLIRDKLAEYLKWGEDLQRVCADFKQPLPQKAADGWYDETATFIGAHVGASYKEQFMSEIEAQPGMADGPIDRANLWNRIQIHLIELRKIMDAPGIQPK